MPYYDPKLRPEEIKDRLKKLDVLLYQIARDKQMYDIRVRIEIVGSASLVLNEMNIPLTEDIDIIRMNRYVESEILEMYDMNMRVTTMENYLPYNYQDRLIKYNMKTRIVDYYFLCLEDAIVAKIVAARPKDDNQLEYIDASKIDWKQLKISMEEMKLSLLNINDYKWMALRYNKFVRRYGHEEVIITDL